ncbi:MAG: hypothetical protein NVS1B11_29240 [Terriglobales bacterium]
MTCLSLTSAVAKDLNLEQRIKLILNLTHRIELLDDLLRVAGTNLISPKTESCLADMEGTAGLDTNLAF